MTTIARASQPAYRLDCHVAPGDRASAIARDVRAGLTATPRWLSPKYFYDARGCELFEAITGLPEYYQTRTELGILRDIAPALIARYSNHPTMNMVATAYTAPIRTSTM